MPSDSGVRLNTTKLTSPPIPEDFIQRTRLRDRLELIVRRPLTLVCAPMGYGKTTAVSAWLKESTLPHAWLSLDEADSEPATFLFYFLRAIRQSLPTFGDELAAPLNSAVLLPTDVFVEMFHAELDAVGQDVVLVLDDFQFILNSVIHGFIGALMRHPHRLFHLVLVSRHDPPLPINEWRARNQMVDIRASDLRFSLDETNTFLAATVDGTLNPDTVGALHSKVEGWPAALRLATLSAAQADDAGAQIQMLSGTNQYIIGFMTEQILAALPEEQRLFLLQTSILDRLCGSLCESVIDQPGSAGNGRAILRELNRKNLFVVPLDSADEWFRYHHLFAEFLRNRLAREYSLEEVAALNLRASRWFATHGFLEEAIRHAMIAGDMDEAVRLFAANRHDLLNHEQWGRLLALYNLFPASVVSASPDLLLIRAWQTHAVRYDLQELSQVTSQAEALLARLDLDPARKELLRAENVLFTAIIHYYQRDSVSCLAACLQALEMLPASYYIIRNLAWVYGSAAQQLSGDMAGSYTFAKMGIREDLAFHDFPRGRNRSAEAFLDWVNGDLAGMKRIGEQLVRIASVGQQYNSLGWAHYFLASAYYHWNDLANAEHHAQQAFESRFSNHAISSIYCGYILALVHQASGRSDRALEVMADVAAFAMHVRSPSFQFLADAMQAELDIIQGQPHKAGNWVDRAGSLIRQAAMPLFFAPQLTVVKAHLAAGTHPKNGSLADCLGDLHEQVEADHNTRFLIEILALEAICLDSKGDEKGAFAKLERSLVLAEPSAFIRLYVDLGPRMKDLLSRYRQQGGDYVGRILEAFPAPPYPVNSDLIEPLTDRELQVLERLAHRYSNKEIASELVISPVTVKRHTINIYQKLNVQSRRQAVEMAERLGILQ